MDNYDLFRELGIAMNRNPDLTILEMIDMALDRHNATRNFYGDYLLQKQSLPKWNPSNSDIYTALKKYNEGH